MKMNYFKILIALLLVFCFQPILGQQKTITGKVTDANNTPIPGVNVLLQGTNQGTQTDFDGEFTIVANSGDVLIFSYLGLSAENVTIGMDSTISLVMEEEAGLLDEVILVGYGSQKKSDITGSISSVKSADLLVLPTQRVDQSLQGRAAGVSVLNTDGAPGGNTRIRIRGMNSILGGNEALIVIDGVQGGKLENLNPDDIESIEILKDASATAIYGSKGANGVVLVSTKLGNTGKPIVTYSYNYGLQSITRELDLMNATEYTSTVNAAIATNNQNGPPNLPFTDAEIASFGEGTNWQDAIFETAPIQNHQFSVGGGTENVKYFFSTGFIDQDGILLNTNFKRINFRSNISANISKRIKVGLNLAMVESKGSVTPFGEDVTFLGNSILVAPRWGAHLPVYDENGNYTKHPVEGYGPQDTWNPVASALETSTENFSLDNLINGFVDIQIIDNLSFKATVGRNVVETNNRVYYNGLTMQGLPVNGKPGNGSIFDSRLEFWQNSNLLTYSNEFEKHRVEVTGAFEQQVQNTIFNNIEASQFTVDATALDDLAGADFIINTSGASKRVLKSYFGRLNYAFDDKYILTATIRADGSSVFGENNKWGYFPSTALAWRVSEENFLKESSWLSTLKLRASWGITGNQGIPPFTSLASVSSDPGRYNYPFDGGDGVNLGLAITGAANPDLKWETTEQLNFGVDLSFFNSRLNSTVDIYYKDTDDLLLNRILPGYTGLSSITDNVGSTENNGVEISISGDPFVGKFSWNTAFNVSWNNNSVVDLGGDERIQFGGSLGGYGVNSLTFLEAGESFGSWYGYEFLGIWSENERSQAAEFGQLPGDQKFKDVSGPDGIPDGRIDTSDIAVIGNALPDFIYGWNNAFKFNNIDLSFLFQGSHGNEVFNQGRIRMEAPGDGASSRLLDRWTPENQDTDIPAFIDARTRLDANLTNMVSLGSSQNATSRFVEDASYLRLKNIMLGFNFPDELTKKFKLNSLRTFISATNVFTITDYTGYDPEVSSFNGNDAQVGVDLGNYPIAKTISIGLQVSF